MELSGIDVSYHQGTIDWKKVKEAGIAFAYVRAGYSDNAGNLREDKQFKRNMDNAYKAGIPTGVYVYSYDDEPQKAAQTAHQTLKLVKPYHLAYPIAFDIEDEKIHLSLSAGQNTSIAKSFLSVIEQEGYRPMLYTYLSFASYNLNMKELAGYDLWIAHFSEVCGYKGPYTIWQYSSTGRIDGIDTPVDLDVSYRDYAHPPQPGQHQQPA